MINAGARYVDKAVVSDGNLVSSRVPSDLPEFARAMIEVFRKSQLLQAPQQV
jgi:protease I